MVLEDLVPLVGSAKVLCAVDLAQFADAPLSLLLSRHWQ